MQSCWSCCWRWVEGGRAAAAAAAGDGGIGGDYEHTYEGKDSPSAFTGYRTRPLRFSAPMWRFDLPSLSREKHFCSLARQGTVRWQVSPAGGQSAARFRRRWVSRMGRTLAIIVMMCSRICSVTRVCLWNGQVSGTLLHASFPRIKNTLKEIENRERPGVMVNLLAKVCNKYLTLPYWVVNTCVVSVLNAVSTCFQQRQENKGQFTQFSTSYSPRSHSTGPFLGWVSNFLLISFPLCSLCSQPNVAEKDRHA